jgi:hypothetical protein
MPYTHTIPFRCDDRQFSALQHISVSMKTDISTVIRLCVDDGIETFIRWSGKDVSALQPDHDLEFKK